MKAIILAAGEGTRLRPYTTDRPKCLVELGGRPLLAWQIDALRAAGVDEIVAVTGYLADQVAAFGLPTRENPRYAETNMVASLMFAREDLAGDTDVLIAYADILYEPGIVEALMASEADLATTIDLEWRKLWDQRMADPLADAETLKLDGGGRILELGKKPASLDEIQGQYMGLVKVAASLAPRLVETWDRLGREAADPKKHENMYMTDFLQYLADHVAPLMAVPVRGGWIEVDSREDLELYRSRFDEGRLDELVRLPAGGA